MRELKHGYAATVLGFHPCRLVGLSVQDQLWPGVVTKRALGASK